MKILETIRNWYWRIRPKRHDYMTAKWNEQNWEGVDHSSLSNYDGMIYFAGSLTIAEINCLKKTFVATQEEG